MEGRRGLVDWLRRRHLVDWLLQWRLVQRRCCSLGDALLPLQRFLGVNLLSQALNGRRMMGALELHCTRHPRYRYVFSQGVIVTAKTRQLAASHVRALSSRVRRGGLSC